MNDEELKIIYGARESGKTWSWVEKLWEELYYKKYRTRISHITHTRRKLWQRKK